MWKKITYEHQRCHNNVDVCPGLFHEIIYVLSASIPVNIKYTLCRPHCINDRMFGIERSLIGLAARQTRVNPREPEWTRPKHWPRSDAWGQHKFSTKGHEPVLTFFFTCSWTWSTLVAANKIPVIDLFH